MNIFHLLRTLFDDPARSRREQWGRVVYPSSSSMRSLKFLAISLRVSSEDFAIAFETKLASEAVNAFVHTESFISLSAMVCKKM